MEQSFCQLLSVLSQETELYRSLADVLGEETRRLVANDTAGILEASRRKDTLALQIRSLEESRLLLVDKFARALGRPPEDLTLSQLAEAAPERLRAPLAQARERLKSVTERAADRNERNRALAENSLALLHGVMERLQSQLQTRVSAPNAYGPARPKGVRPAAGIVVSRQV